MLYCGMRITHRIRPEKEKKKKKKGFTEEMGRFLLNRKKSGGVLL